MLKSAGSLLMPLLALFEIKTCKLSKYTGNCAPVNSYMSDRPPFMIYAIMVALNFNPYCHLFPKNMLNCKTFTKCNKKQFILTGSSMSEANRDGRRKHLQHHPPVTPISVCTTQDCIFKWPDLFCNILLLLSLLVSNVILSHYPSKPDAEISRVDP